MNLRSASVMPERIFFVIFLEWRQRSVARSGARAGDKMRSIGKAVVILLAVIIMATTADAQSRRKREREQAPPAAAPSDKRDRLVAAPGSPFTGHPYWQAMAQCGGIYFKLNTLYSTAAIQAKVVKPDAAANAQFTKKSDAARRTATAFFEAAERFLIADRGRARDEAMPGALPGLPPSQPENLQRPRRFGRPAAVRVMIND